MGNARFRTLSDFSKHHANVGAVCSCGHQGVVHRDPFARWCSKYMNNDMTNYTAIHLAYGKTIQ